MLRFGIVKGLPRPKPAEMQKLLESHKTELPELEKLTLNYNTKTAGQAGIRHFKYLHVPHLKHWNKDCQFEVNAEDKKTQKPPSLTLKFKQGKILNVPVPELRDYEILEKLVQEYNVAAERKITSAFLQNIDSMMIEPKPLSRAARKPNRSAAKTTADARAKEGTPEDKSKSQQQPPRTVPSP